MTMRPDEDRRLLLAIAKAAQAWLDAENEYRTVAYDGERHGLWERCEVTRDALAALLAALTEERREFKRAEYERSRDLTVTEAPDAT